jgi:hypothetical protein
VASFPLFLLIVEGVADGGIRIRLGAIPDLVDEVHHGVGFDGQAKPIGRRAHVCRSIEDFEHRGAHGDYTPLENVAESFSGAKGDDRFRGLRLRGG